MIRRFLYMTDFLGGGGGGGGSLSQTLRRFDTSRLFYPNDGLVPRSASPAAAAVVEDVRLPPAILSFDSMGFMRMNNDKIVTTDDTGRRAILYDPATHTVRALPDMATRKFRTISLAVADDLYVMERSPRPDNDGGGGEPHHSFEALVRLRGERRFGIGKEADGCYWRPLPPPPYVHAAGGGYGGRAVAETCAYAASPQRILVSSWGHGTYSFDPASAEWSKAGDWTLPFCDRGEHVVEHGLVFGISADEDGVLGAWDLSSSATLYHDRPPAARLEAEGFTAAGRRKWKGMPAPEVWVSQVVNLGGGRLCVAKLFTVVRWGTCPYPCCVGEQDKTNLAMLTGVEVVRDGGGGGGELRIVKHKSCRYNFDENTPTYVL